MNPCRLRIPGKPAVRQIFKTRTGGNPVVRIAYCRVIYITAYITYVFLHLFFSCRLCYCNFSLSFSARSLPKLKHFSKSDAVGIYLTFNSGYGNSKLHSCNIPVICFAASPLHPNEPNAPPILFCGRSPAHVNQKISYSRIHVVVQRRTATTTTPHPISLVTAILRSEAED